MLPQLTSTFFDGHSAESMRRTKRVRQRIEVRPRALSNWRRESAVRNSSPQAAQIQYFTARRTMPRRRSNSAPSRRRHARSSTFRIAEALFEPAFGEFVRRQPGAAAADSPLPDGRGSDCPSWLRGFVAQIRRVRSRVRKRRSGSGYSDGESVSASPASSRVKEERSSMAWMYCSSDLVAHLISRLLFI